MRRLFLASLVAFGFAAPAEAGSTHYVGSFSTPLLPWYGNATSLSGSFSFTWDDSHVAGAGSGSVFYKVALDSIDMDRLGDTTFDTSNAGVELLYNDGVFMAAVLGGLLGDHIIGGVDASGDDFYAAFSSTDGRLDGATPYGVAAATYASMSVTASSGPISGMIVAAAVPEPATFAMLGVGALGALGLARRHRAA